MIYGEIRQFDEANADPNRDAFEIFGRRIAFHAERRDDRRVWIVVAEMLRFTYEQDHPNAKPADLPLSAVIDDPRIVAAIENFSNAITVGGLLKCDPQFVRDIPMIGNKAFAKIIGAIAGAFGVENFDNLRKLSPDWATVVVDFLEQS